VSLRNRDGWRTQSCDLNCRQCGQYRQWSGSRALRVRTGRIRLGVMMPGGMIMAVMTWRVMMAQVILGQGRSVGVT
jgi:hypothetical protein